MSNFLEDDDSKLLGKMFTSPDWQGLYFCVVETGSVDWCDRCGPPLKIILLIRNHEITVNNDWLPMKYYHDGRYKFIEMTNDEVKMLNMIHPEYKYQHWVDLYRNKKDD